MFLLLGMHRRTRGIRTRSLNIQRLLMLILDRPPTSRTHVHHLGCVGIVRHHRRHRRAERPIEQQLTLRPLRPLGLVLQRVGVQAGGQTAFAAAALVHVVYEADLHGVQHFFIESVEV